MTSQPQPAAKPLGPCRVVKLGGSLFDLPHLGERLQGWLDGEPEKLTMLVSGGGGIVEAMRQLDAVHQFDPIWCHWRCVELMQLTAKIVELQLPCWLAIQTPAELQDCLAAGRASVRAVVYPAAFYTPEIARSDGVCERLPESWATTSDSLAAYLAKRVMADELVLLKSVSPIPHRTGFSSAGVDEELRYWQSTGLVDEYFGQVAAGIGVVRTVNLRASP